MSDRPVRQTVRDRIVVYPAPKGLPRLDDEQRRSAALKGARWLVEIQARTPLRRLHRNAGDPQMVRALESARHIWSVLPKPLNFNPLVRQWSRLNPMLGSLLERRAHGIDISADISVLRNWLALDLTRTWRDNPTRQLVCAHLLHALGLATREDYERHADAIRAARPPEQSERYRNYLGSVAHILICDSGYLRRRLEGERYTHELTILAEGLETYLARGMNGFEADTAAELVFCFKLCEVRNDERLDIMQAWLASLQETDGAWHPADWPRSRTHRTSVTVQALMDWSDQPRSMPGLDF